MDRIIKKRLFRVANENMDENKINKYGDEYRNKEGKITPYHILFNDFSDKILSLDKKESIHFCFKKIQDIQNKHMNHLDYQHIDNEEILRFKKELKKSNDSLDILFYLKEMIIKQ